MLNTPTVLVTGAGASAAYGFPLGLQLKSNVVSALASEASDSAASIVAQASGAPMSTVQRFRVDLANSNAASIDAFLVSTGDKYDQIGRCAIALELLQLETDKRLFPARDVDWYGVLFDSILRDPVAFREHFKVVTFNFERSYERRLYHELSGRFKGTDLERDVYFDDVYYKIVHVHGSLGVPTWQRLHRYGGGAHDYAPVRDPGRVFEAAKNVRLFRDAITDGMARVTQDCLASAERILFVGFSYHPSNLLKLGVQEVLAGKDVRGTVFGMNDAEIARMHAQTGGHVKTVPRDWSVLEAISGCEWFREG